jgi:hypothetical protein
LLWFCRTAQGNVDRCLSSVLRFDFTVPILSILCASLNDVRAGGEHYAPRNPRLKFQLLLTVDYDRATLLAVQKHCRQRNIVPGASACWWLLTLPFTEPLLNAQR